jgi:hypothetical protein
MLSWLRKRFEAKAKVQPAPPHVLGVRVVAGQSQIELHVADRAPAVLSWSDLASVVIVTTSGGPAEADLFWHLVPRERHKAMLRIPMGAEGEHDLLVAMQGRLQGFDNMAVVEAMGSTSEATFTVWDTSSMANQ